MGTSLQLIALEGIPACAPGDDLSGLIVASLAQGSESLQDGDVLAIAQKVVSKVEGRYVLLDSVTPSPEALELAELSGKDPRVVELILGESNEVVRVKPGVMVVEHRNGYVHANAGIDQSNIPQLQGRAQVLLLPEDSNASARRLRDALQHYSGKRLGVLVCDSVGRAWRNGTTGMALGSAGVKVLHNRNGELDMYGRPLQATEVAVADELASAAALVMGEAAERLPVVLIRGGDFLDPLQNCDLLIRDKSRDMFR